jgi:hypothetical protein
VGTQFPICKNIRVERYEMAEEDREVFDEISFLVDLDYRGGLGQRGRQKISRGERKQKSCTHTPTLMLFAAINPIGTTLKS